MPKRKRTENDSLPERQSNRQQHQFEGALSHGKTILFRALKLARGFERQKLGRRQKEARSADSKEQLERIEAEVVALKVSVLVITQKARFTMVAEA